MSKTRVVSIVVVIAVVVCALALVIDRGGLLAWATLLGGLIVLVKLYRKPAGYDLGLSLGLAAIASLGWFGTLHYVVSTWESGEVVQLAIDTPAGVHTARLWVMDIDNVPVVYYDAEPAAADSLLAGKPVVLTRGGSVTTRTPEASPIDALSESEGSAVLDAMAQKYGDRNNAAGVYYVLLGRSRDRVPLIARLHEQ